MWENSTLFFIFRKLTFQRFNYNLRKLHSHRHNIVSYLHVRRDCLLEIKTGRDNIVYMSTMTQNVVSFHRHGVCHIYIKTRSVQYSHGRWHISCLMSRTGIITTLLPFINKYICHIFQLQTCILGTNKYFCEGIFRAFRLIYIYNTSVVSKGKYVKLKLT